jgi:hypothetical protein
MDEQNPQQRPPQRKLFSPEERNWRGILIAILFVVVTIIAIILITNLSDVAADMRSTSPGSLDEPQSTRMTALDLLHSWN